MRKKILSESKADAQLAIVKCLTGGKLTPAEVNEVCALTQAELMKDYGCDLYMAETVKLYSKRELFRLRSQNQFTKLDGLWNGTGYPTKPYTRTANIKESRRSLLEDHKADGSEQRLGGRMLDYGQAKSDSDEGRMMKQALRDLAVDAYRLHQMIDDGDDLPQWCQYKAAQAQQMMGTVRNYLEYKLERMGEDKVGEKEMFDPEELESDFGKETVDDLAVQPDFAEEYQEHEPEIDEDEYEYDSEDAIGYEKSSDMYDYSVEEFEPEEDEEQVKDHMPKDWDAAGEGYDGADEKISLDKEEK